MHEQNATEELPSNREMAGTLEPEEKALIDNLRRRANELVTQVGEHEVHKARLLGAISDVEAKVQGTLQGVAKRLKLPDGRRWFVTGEQVFVETDEASGVAAAE